MKYIQNRSKSAKCKNCGQNIKIGEYILYNDVTGQRWHNKCEEIKKKGRTEE